MDLLTILQDSLLVFPLVGFLQQALSVAQLVAPFLGKLFGGGAPQFSDLTPNTQASSALTTDALRQSQDLREGAIADSQALKDIDVANARSIGAFDPTSFGEAFGFLGDQQSQFSDVDFGARGMGAGIDRTLQIAQLAQQIGAMAPSLNLGIDNLLAQSGAQAGGGFGAAIGNTLAGLGNQQAMGTGLFSGGGGQVQPLLGGEQPFAGDAGPSVDFSGAPQPSGLPPALSQGGGGTAQALGLGPPQGGGGFDANILQQIISSGGIPPLIQALVEGSG